MTIPDKLSLAHLPTPIDQIRRIELPRGKKLFLKRDDQTGTELSGNKIRKLEFLLYDALEQGCDTLITCGGVQSNHARATAAAAAKLGLRCSLVLSSPTRVLPAGNLLLDKLFGATVQLVSPRDFGERLEEIMQQLADEATDRGAKAYQIPVGASNPLGTFGYFLALQEILDQERALGISLDTIVCSVGSGGTYAGLVFANQLLQAGKKIVGINISQTADHFRLITQQLWQGFSQIAEVNEDLTEPLHILDGYAGRGYALNTAEEVDFVRDFARETGVVLDPVYTGKAMRGLMESLKQNHRLFEASEHILFIHTGGLFGLFPKAEEFLLD